MAAEPPKLTQEEWQLNSLKLTQTCRWSALQAPWHPLGKIAVLSSMIDLSIQKLWDLWELDVSHIAANECTTQMYHFAAALTAMAPWPQSGQGAVLIRAGHCNNGLQCHYVKQAAAHQAGEIAQVTFVLHFTLGASWGYDVEMTKSKTKLPALQQHTQRQAHGRCWAGCQKPSPNRVLSHAARRL